MTKYITIVGGRAFSVEEDVMTILPDGVWEVTKKRINNRTVQQNRAIHLYCKQVAEALNESGHSVTYVLKPETSFSMLTVKEQIYKPILTALRGKESTTQINTDEMNAVYDVMNKALSQKFGLHIPFPSIESMLFEQNYKGN